MKKSILLIICLNTAVYAADPLCTNISGPEFTSGDGSIENPFLICNKSQFIRLANELPLLKKNFKLGAHIDFDFANIKPIGTEQIPFEGNFAGNNYMLTNLKITANNRSYVGIFGNVKNATISDLMVNNITIDENNDEKVGSLIGAAENSNLYNLHVSAINMLGAKSSGGLIGELNNSNLQLASAQGQVADNCDVARNGGLIGYAYNSNISSSMSVVNISISCHYPENVSDIGNLIGGINQSKVKNVYALGNIISSKDDISYPLPSRVGGVIGSMHNSNLSYAFYAGKLQVIANYLGGAVGIATNDIFDNNPSINVYWDINTSPVKISSIGQAEESYIMKQSSFWYNNGFDHTIWDIANGTYPALIGVSVRINNLLGVNS